MKIVAWIILGVLGLAAAAFAVLWIWGTLAFTPPRVITAIIGEGELGDGVIYEIVRGGSALTPTGYSVTLGTHELGLRYTSVGFDAEAPRPLSVTRAAPDRVDVLL